ESGRDSARGRLQRRNRCPRAKLELEERLSQRSRNPCPGGCALPGFSGTPTRRISRQNQRRESGQCLAKIVEKDDHARTGMGDEVILRTERKGFAGEGVGVWRVKAVFRRDKLGLPSFHPGWALQGLSINLPRWCIRKTTTAFFD